MSNPVGKHASLKNQARNIADRMAEMESTLARILVAINKRFDDLNEKFGIIDEYMLAVMETVGADVVTKKVEDNRAAQAKAQAEAAEAQLNQAVADGYMVPTDTIEERSYLVGVEKDGEGNAVGVGRFQIPFSQIQKDFKEQLLGKGVGVTVTTPLGGTFEVTAIYNADEEKYRQVQGSKLQAQAEAAAQAANQVASADEATDTGVVL